MTESTATGIKCTLGPQNTSKTTKLVTNDSSQTDGFSSGSGLNYKMFYYSGSSIFSFVNSVRGGTSMTVIQEGVRTELKSYPVGTYKGQVWKGYFVAPESGVYTFRGWAQYAFALYISPTYGSVKAPSSPLIYSSHYQQTYANFFYDNKDTASGSITLEANRSYYLEAYHIAYSYSGSKFKIFAEVPNSNSNLSFQTYHVDQIDTSADHRSEVMVYTMEGGNGGAINLKIVRLDSKGRVTYKSERNVSYGCSASSFNSALAYFNSFSSYQRSTVRKMFDASGN